MTKEDESFDSEVREVKDEVNRLYRENETFNEVLDTEGLVEVSGYEFLPSEILRELEPEGYKEALRDWQDEQFNQLLSYGRDILETYESNRDHFEHVIELIRSDKMIPFVGAGLSVPCGNPSWSAFLLEMVKEINGDCQLVEERMQQGDFDGVAQDIIDKMNSQWFSGRLKHRFTRQVELKGPVLLLPSLFRGCLITTNFDRILEDVYHEAGQVLEKIFGVYANTFRTALSGAEPRLLKIHGDVEYGSENRILTKEEYDSAYGEENIDWSLSLPQAIRRAFSSYSLLFLGCSLRRDRTMEVWRVIVEEEGESLPMHYAVVEAPKNDADLVDRTNFLTEHGIFPIWYPHREHDAVEALLTLAVEVVEEREDIDS